MILGIHRGYVALLDIQNRILFSGDTVQDGTIFMFGVQREMHAYLKSFEKLELQKDWFDWIYLSHGTISVTPDLIAQLHRAACAVLAGEVDAQPAQFHGLMLKRYDAGCVSFLCEL